MGDTQDIKLFQICYDEATWSELPPGFDGLDNSHGPVEFREIVPMFRYIKEATLHDNEWLGFFSPKFSSKTGLDAFKVRAAVASCEDDTDAVLFSSFWWEISRYQSVWEQGEFVHPGLIKVSQELADQAGYQIPLIDAVSTFDTAVYSHFLVAKASFWNEWRRIVEIYLNMVVSDDELFGATTKYGDEQIPIHPFVAERVPSLILTNPSFKAKAHRDLIDGFPPTDLEQLFNPNTKEGAEGIAWYPFMMKMMDDMKEAFLATGERKFLQEYWRCRLKTPVREGAQHMTSTFMNFLDGNRNAEDQLGLSFLENSILDEMARTHNVNIMGIGG